MVDMNSRSRIPQVANADEFVRRRQPSEPSSAVFRRKSASSFTPLREPTINKRAVTLQGGRTAIAAPEHKPSPTRVRRQLPWLDGKGPTKARSNPGLYPRRHVPGGFDESSSVYSSSVSSSSDYKAPETPPPPPPRRTTSKPFLLSDPRVRYIGSDSNVHQYVTKRPSLSRNLSTGSHWSTASPGPKDLERPPTVIRRDSPTNEDISALEPVVSPFSDYPSPSSVANAYSSSSAPKRGPAPAVMPAVSNERRTSLTPGKGGYEPTHKLAVVPSADGSQRITVVLADRPIIPKGDPEPLPGIPDRSSRRPTLQSQHLPPSLQKIVQHPSPAEQIFPPKEVPEPMTTSLPEGSQHSFSAPRRTMTVDVSPGSKVPREPYVEAEPPEAGLQRALTGLEDLVQEAIDVARTAAETQHPEDVADILEDAKDTLRQASSFQQATTRRMTFMDPLQVDDPDLEAGSSDEESLYSVSTDEEDKKTSHASSRTTLTKGVQGPPGGTNHPNDSVNATPLQYYNRPSRESIARDFAFPTTDRRGRRRSRSSSSFDENPPEALRRVKTGLGTHHVNFPLDPVLSPTGAQRTVLPAVDNVNPFRTAAIPGAYSTPVSPRGYSLAQGSKYTGDGPRRRRKLRQSRASFPGGYKDSETDTFQTRPRWIDPNTRGLSLRNRHHFTLQPGEKYSPGRSQRRKGIARNWRRTRKRIVAAVACINTALIGFIIGVYAGEVPRIQYTLADQAHYIIQGNVYFYIGLAITTFIFWPLPLLHGRKPYTLAALALALPLHFPEAVIVSTNRSPDDPVFRFGLLFCRFLSGLVLGFLNINCFTTLLDLFGASLQSQHPHQELVIIDDVRRHGGGMGLWLGIWAWCFIASIAIGFQVGAAVIQSEDPDWGFYIVVILMALVLLLNVIMPETRRSAYRRSVLEMFDEKDEVKTRVARGEVKLHISETGPKYWWEEVTAGLKLSFKMFFQPGMAVMALYLGWIYAQIVLVIVLLGALLSRSYRIRSSYVGLGVMAIAFGALFAIPLTKAGIFSRDRKQKARTDSMTFQPQVSWSSHMVRRIVFTVALPLAGIAYTLLSHGSRLHWMWPIVFAGVIGFLSCLAIAECNGLIMEAYDTSDLQPGVNSKHRLQSLAENVRNRRTNYSSFPRVAAGIFLAQTIGFLLAAAATGVGGALTRTYGAQISTAVTAGILLGCTLLLTAVLWRFRSIQVIPDIAFGTRRDTIAWKDVDEYWKPVIIGNPSGKVRRMNILEMGKLSRWTEIRRLNNLIQEDV